MFYQINPNPDFLPVSTYILHLHNIIWHFCSIRFHLNIFFLSNDRFYILSQSAQSHLVHVASMENVFTQDAHTVGLQSMTWIKLSKNDIIHWQPKRGKASGYLFQATNMIKVNFCTYLRHITIFSFSAVSLLKFECFFCIKHSLMTWWQITSALW